MAVLHAERPPDDSVARRAATRWRCCMGAEGGWREPAAEPRGCPGPGALSCLAGGRREAEGSVCQALPQSDRLEPGTAGARSHVLLRQSDGFRPLILRVTLERSHRVGSKASFTPGAAWPPPGHPQGSRGLRPRLPAQGARRGFRLPVGQVGLPSTPTPHHYMVGTKPLGRGPGKCRKRGPGPPLGSGPSWSLAPSLRLRPLSTGHKRGTVYVQLFLKRPKQAGF